MRKLIILIILFSTSAGVSYYHSERIYNFYLKVYYTNVLKYKEQDFVKKIKLLQSKNNRRDAINLINIALGLYPGNRYILQAAGYYYFDNGQKNKGAILLLKSLNKSQSDYMVFEKIIEFLFKNRMYKVIVNNLTGYNLEKYNNLQFYYGASLYKLNRINEAASYLQAVEKNSYQDAELYYYLALINYKNHKNDIAVKYAQQAYSLDGNKKSANLLIKLYSETRQYEKAGKIIQKRTK